MSTIGVSDARIVLLNGTLYSPAKKHYFETNQNAVVRCDYCSKNNISVSIGYKNLDICLKCASEIEKHIKSSEQINNREIVTNMMQDSVRTRMMEDLVRIKPITKMMEDLVRILPENNSTKTYMSQDSARSRHNVTTDMMQDSVRKIYE